MTQGNILVTKWSVFSEDMKSPLADTPLPTHLIRIIQYNTGLAGEERESGEECTKLASDLLLSLLVGGKKIH